MSSGLSDFEREISAFAGPLLFEKQHLLSVSMSVARLHTDRGECKAQRSRKACWRAVCCKRCVLQALCAVRAVYCKGGICCEGG